MNEDLRNSILDHTFNAEKLISQRNAAVVAYSSVTHESTEIHNNPQHIWGYFFDKFLVGWVKGLYAGFSRIKKTTDAVILKTALDKVLTNGTYVIIERNARSYLVMRKITAF